MWCKIHRTPFNNIKFHIVRNTHPYIWLGLSVCLIGKGVETDELIFRVFPRVPFYIFQLKQNETQ